MLNKLCIKCIKLGNIKLLVKCPHCNGFGKNRNYSRGDPYDEGRFETCKTCKGVKEIIVSGRPVPEYGE